MGRARLPAGCERGGRRPARRRRGARRGAGRATPCSTWGRTTRCAGTRPPRSSAPTSSGTANVLAAAAAAGVPLGAHLVGGHRRPARRRAAPGDEDTPLPRLAGDRRLQALQAGVGAPRVWPPPPRASASVIVNPTAPVGPGRPRAHAHRPHRHRLPAPGACRPTSTPASTWWTCATSPRATAWRSSAARRGRRYILGNENLTLRADPADRWPGSPGGGRRGCGCPTRWPSPWRRWTRPIEGRMLGREPLAPLDGALHGPQAHVRRRLARRARAGPAPVAGADGAGRRDRLVPGRRRAA